MFDVGQIEVLKGPQGTTRGVPAPSGAITVTTHKPDLSEFGGYVSGIATDLHGRNAQGALNIPIIKDVLAVRVAGLVDQNDFDGVRSIHSSLRPSAKTTGERLSVSFEPNDRFNANVLYQHLDRSQSGFQQVTGPGNGTAVNPPISPDRRVAVQDLPTTFSMHIDRVVAQVDSRIFGQHLSYVGSYFNAKVKNNTAQDSGNVLPGAELFQTGVTTNSGTAHEIRLASDPAPGRFFDYVVGAYYAWGESSVALTNPGPLFPGAFGPPNQPPVISALNPAFQIPVLITGPNSVQETDLFGSVTLHLGDKTELSAGVRHMAVIRPFDLNIALGNGLMALPASLFAGNCAAARLPSTYPGFCDFTLNTAGTPVSNTTSRSSDRPNIYNVSLSHHVTRDLLVYANTGTSWGAPWTSIGIQGALTASADPVLSSLTFHPATTSTSYEVGFKATFLEGRARLNASAFRQRFRNLILGVPGITYLNTATGQPAQADLSASVDALVQGFDIDAAWQVNRDWNIAVQGSYAHSQIEGSLVPCNITGPAGQPVFNRGGLISVCPGGAATRLPLWNLTAQTEYSHPITEKANAFVRGLLNYYPENKYVEPNFAAPNYSLVGVYTGVRSQDGAWEVSIFARNALNTEKQLDQGPQTINTLAGSLGSSFPTLNVGSGYYTANFTPRREVGLSARYAWGSR